MCELGLFDLDQCLPALDGITHGDMHRSHYTSIGCCDFGLHFHGFKDEQYLPGINLIPLVDQDLEY